LGAGLIGFLMMFAGAWGIVSIALFGMKYIWEPLLIIGGLGVSGIAINWGKHDLRELHKLMKKDIINKRKREVR
jgi:hypothetical protein